jgi:hypothetical protein
VIAARANAVTWAWNDDDPVAAAAAIGTTVPAGAAAAGNLDNDIVGRANRRDRRRLRRRNGSQAQPGGKSEREKLFHKSSLATVGDDSSQRHFASEFHRTKGLRPNILIKYSRDLF